MLGCYVNKEKVVKIGVVKEEMTVNEPFGENESIRFYDYVPDSEEGIYARNHEGLSC